MVSGFTRRLAGSGLLATLDRDPWRTQNWILSIDGTAQSHVDLSDPTALHFDYIARMGHIIDLAFEDGTPITALHLGAGAMTLPRYIAHTRPGSTGRVVEIETDLIPFVTEHCPLPDGMTLRYQFGDARDVVTALRKDVLGTVDLIIVDIFRGARTPAHTTSVEFYDLLRSLLSPRGLILVNCADGPPMRFARGQLATLRYVWGDTFAVAEQGVLASERYGNIVLGATAQGTVPEWVSELVALGPHPASVVTGQAAAEWSASAPLVTDNTAIDSPPPGRHA